MQSLFSSDVSPFFSYFRSFISFFPPFSTSTPICNDFLFAVCFSCKNVDVGDVLRGVLSCVRRHSVRVDMEYATLILNILCLDSMAKVSTDEYKH